MASEINEILCTLQAGRDQIHSKLSELSIQGRGLTPQEAAFLEVLPHAHKDVARALERLTGIGDEPAMELPEDGRYPLANDVLDVELRIDLTGSKIVSGDVFAKAHGHREYLASFRSEPGSEVTPTMNPLSIAAEDMDGRRARGQIEVIPSTSNEISARLTFDSKLRGLPIRQSVSLAGRRVGEAMRELGLEFESEVGLDPNPTWSFNGRTVSIESALTDAGLNITNVGRRDQISSPPSGEWDLSQLHGLMFRYAQEPMDRSTWNLHLLLLNKSRERGLLGIMFDSGRRDVNQLPRQGVAVFVDPMRYRPDFNRKLIQTTVHELGHALNLAHRFERPVGRADSNSFMNYDWKYLGGRNRDKFWRDFQFTFDPDELAFLRHGPWQNVIPGGAEFHSVPYWENSDGGYVPYIPEVPSSDLTLELTAPQDNGLFQFAQPVLLTVSLTNNTGRTIDLPRFFLDPKAGFLELVVQKRVSPASGGGNSGGMVFRPIAHRCFDLEQAGSDRVPSGDKLVDNLNLTFGSAGFTFAEPGDYQVTAYFLWPKSRGDIRTIRSAPLSIRVAHPKTDDEEREALELFRWDVGYYFALGGSDVLTDAEDVLESVAQRRQGKSKHVDDPLVANIRRCQAINMSRDFVTYEDGQYKTRDAKPDKAQQLLDSISGIMSSVFDQATQAATVVFASELKGQPIAASKNGIVPSPGRTKSDRQKTVKRSS